MRYEVEATVQMSIEVRNPAITERVTGSGGDEWRGQFMVGGRRHVGVGCDARTHGRGGVMSGGPKGAGATVTCVNCLGEGHLFVRGGDGMLRPVVCSGCNGSGVQKVRQAGFIEVGK